MSAGRSAKRTGRVESGMGDGPPPVWKLRVATGLVVVGVDRARRGRDDDRPVGVFSR